MAKLLHERALELPYIYVAFLVSFTPRENVPGID